MTEVEFRGIRVNNGEFIHGYLYQSNKESCITDSVNIHLSTHRNIAWFQVKPETVGQYIGLKKGERKIYDGDILFDEIEGDNGDERHYFVVRWLKEKCSFVFMDYADTVTNWEKFKEDLWHDWPVQVDQEHLDAMHYAGNIHEHPKLLLS